METTMVPAEDLEERLGAGVRQLRVTRRLTQAELAERANVSLGALRHLERGEGSTTNTLAKVLVALGSGDWLGTLAPDPAPFNPLVLLEARRRQGPSRVRRGPRTP